MSFQIDHSLLWSSFNSNNEELKHSLLAEDLKFQKQKNLLDSSKAKLFAVSNKGNKRTKFDIGGCLFKFDRSILSASSADLSGGYLFALLSGRYDHLLPKDKNGRIFLDLDIKWIQPHFNLLVDLSMWDGEDESKRPTVSKISPTHVDAFNAVSAYFQLNHSSRHSVNSEQSIAHTSNVLCGEFPNVDMDLLNMMTDDHNTAMRLVSATLRYRGSRDGFQAADFHSRCDGVVDTLTLVRDTDGNVFGGFSDVAWKSGPNTFIDTSTTSFIFSLRKMGVHKAIKMPSIHNKCGVPFSGAAILPSFGGGCEFHVCADCDIKHTASYSNLTGTYYSAPSGMAHLSNARNFTVKDIEVFEVKCVHVTDCHYASKNLTDDTQSSSLPGSTQLSDGGKIVLTAALSERTKEVIQRALTPYSQVVEVFQNLGTATAELEQQCVQFLDELKFVAKHCDLALPKMGESASRATTDIIASTCQAIHDASGRNNRPAVTINLCGTVLAVSKTTLLQAPSGSILANMASDVWGHDLDSDGNIVQDVNPRLFTAIINHLRLTALLPASEVPPIVVYKQDRPALENLLAFYAMSEVPVKSVNIHMVEE